jgi:hypothetical protein
MPARKRGRVFPKKTRPNPARLHLKKRLRRKLKTTTATLVTVLEPAHLAVHGIHRTERTLEKIGRRFEPDKGLLGAPLQYLVGSRVEWEDLDIPDDALAQMEAEIHDTMENTGADIVGEASDTAPVDTGFLRDSLYYNVEDIPLSLMVGDTAPYASYVEKGTVRYAGRPFLSLAMAGNEAEMEAEIDGIVATAMDEQAQNEDAGLIGPGETEAEIEMETEITLAEEVL